MVLEIVMKIFLINIDKSTLHFSQHFYVSALNYPMKFLTEYEENTLDITLIITFFFGRCNGKITVIVMIISFIIAIL